MPSIRDVAKEAGVSIATVSRVINGSDTVASTLRKQVMKAVEACDYAPAMGRKSLDAIAMIYTGPFCIGSLYDSACLEGIVEVMRESSYDLRIVDIHRDLSPNEKLRQFFMRKGIAGAIVRCTSADRPTVLRMAKENLPLVVLGDHFEISETHSNLSFVYAESKLASREAIEHLVSLGHKRISFASCERDDGDHLDRLNAYREVLEENDLMDETLVCRVPPHRLDGAQLIRNLLGRPNRPTAVYIADPLVAVGAMNEAYRLGVKIPEELSLIGFDDTDTRSTVYPHMSAVCQDSKMLGHAALDLLLKKIEGGASGIESSNDRHSAWFDLGGTSAPPPGNPRRVLPTGKML